MTIIYSDDEHDFESPWLCDVNRGNSYISLALFRLHLLTSINFHWPQIVHYPAKVKAESMEEHSEANIYLE